MRAKTLNHISDVDAWNVIAQDYMHWLAGKGGNFGNAFQNLIVENVLPALGSVQNKRVLDLGCGEGYWARKMASEGADVIALDGAMNMITAAHSSIMLLTIDFIQGDLLRPLPLASQTIDLILCNMVLMDLEQIDVCIAEAYRILTLGGRMVFSIVHPCFYEAIGQWMNINMTKPAFQFTSRYREQVLYKKQLEGLSTKVKLAHYNRPIEFYLQAIIDHGFSLSYFREPGFSPEQLQQEQLPIDFNRYVFTANYIVIAADKR